MDYKDESYDDDFSPHDDRRMTRVIPPHEALGYATAEHSFLPAASDDSVTSQNTSTAIEHVKNMTEEEIHKFINILNLHDDDNDEELVSENEEDCHMDVKEKKQAKSQNKKDPVQPKKMAKKTTKKNVPLLSERQHDIAVLTALTVEPTEGEVKTKKNKRGKKEQKVVEEENINLVLPQHNVTKTKNGNGEFDEKSAVDGKQNKPKRSPRGKQNNAKNTDLESQSDLHYKLGDESDSKDVKSSSENKTKPKRNLKKTKLTENTDSQEKIVQEMKKNIKGLNNKDNIEENLSGIPKKKDMKSSTDEEKVETTKNSESTSTRSTRAKQKITNNVLKVTDDTVNKETTIENQTSSELKVKNVKRGILKKTENEVNEPVGKPTGKVNRAKQKVVETPILPSIDAPEKPKSKANPKTKRTVENKENKANESVAAPKRTTRKK